MELLFVTQNTYKDLHISRTAAEGCRIPKMAPGAFSQEIEYNSMSLRETDDTTQRKAATPAV